VSLGGRDVFCLFAGSSRYIVRSGHCFKGPDEASVNLLDNLAAETRKLKATLGLDPDQRVSDDQLFQAYSDALDHRTLEESPHESLARNGVITVLMALLHDRKEYFSATGWFRPPLARRLPGLRSRPQGRVRAARPVSAPPDLHSDSRSSEMRP